MSKRHGKPEGLIGALATADADRALRTWAEVSSCWDQLAASTQQAALSAALCSRDSWAASAARRFLMERWRELPEPVWTAALDALASLLDDPGHASTIWPYLPDRWSRLPRPLAALLSPNRLRLALDRADVAADAWDFLTTQWDRLPARLKAVATGPKLRAALANRDWRIATAAWEFLTDNWPRLTKELRGVPDTPGLLDSVGRSATLLVVAEFVATHESDLSPDFCQAARARVACCPAARSSGDPTCCRW